MGKRYKPPLKGRAKIQEKIVKGDKGTSPFQLPLSPAVEEILTGPNKRCLRNLLLLPTQHPYYFFVIFLSQN